MEVTHYCRGYEDCPYAGQPLGCGDGVYDPYNPIIVAVGPSRYAEWPCGVVLRMCASVGNKRPDGGVYMEASSGEPEVHTWLRCNEVIRSDSCPGCGHYLIDLSEAAFEALGFTLEQGVGRVTVERSER